MGTSRRVFLGAAGAATIAPAIAAAQTTPAASSAPSSTASPSPAAMAAAESMRKFDATLSDADVRNIAKQIDDNAAASLKLRKKSPLSNGNEPAPEFEAGE